MLSYINFKDNLFYSKEIYVILPLKMFTLLITYKFQIPKIQIKLNSHKKGKSTSIKYAHRLISYAYIIPLSYLYH